MAKRRTSRRLAALRSACNSEPAAPGCGPRGLHTTAQIAKAANVAIAGTRIAVCQPCCERSHSVAGIMIGDDRAPQMVSRVIERDGSAVPNRTASGWVNA